MRRIVTWFLGTICVLVLLFSYHTSRSAVASGASTVAVGGAGASAGSSTPGSASYPGSVVSTRYGNVQVQIVVTDGRISSASVLQVPYQDRRDVQISNRAVPILNAEVVDAQSADIDMVSGATVTSAAYRQSLQAAIDKAHL